MNAAFTPGRLLGLFTKAPHAFWRHDIDLSLDAAVKMARFAQFAGVKSTFYVMASCEYYNPFSAPGRHALGEIAAHGHRIGVHARCGATATEWDREMFRLTCTGLVDTNEVSFHMPEPYCLWRTFDGFHNAYAPEWEGRYLSDSRREFGLEKEALVTNDMQINLHPEHWFS